MKKTLVAGVCVVLMLGLAPAVQAQDLLYTPNNGAVTIAGYTGTVGNALSHRYVVEDDVPWSTTPNDRGRQHSL